MIADLEEMKAGFERLKRIEATKKDLRQKVKDHKGIKSGSVNDPIEY
jgi:uncharacterized protein (UPF0335 family)